METATHSLKLAGAWKRVWGVDVPIRDPPPFLEIPTSFRGSGTLRSLFGYFIKQRDIAVIARSRWGGEGSLTEEIVFELNCEYQERAAMGRSESKGLK